MPASDPAAASAAEPADAALTELIDFYAREFRGHPYQTDGEAPFTLEAGRAVGHFHGLRLQTTLVALRTADGRSVARLALTDARTARGRPVSAWAPYAIALDDTAIAHLDRLIRTVHVLNARAGRATGPLWLPVHPRHLAAVPDAHGAVFATILRRCGLRPADAVLELADAARVADARLATAVAGFRSRGYGVAFGVSDSDPAALGRLLAHAPDAIRLGAPHLRAAAADAAEHDRLRERIAGLRAAGTRVWLPAPATTAEAALVASLGADGWQEAAADAAATP